MKDIYDQRGSIIVILLIFLFILTLMLGTASTVLNRSSDKLNQIENRHGKSTPADS